MICAPAVFAVEASAAVAVCPLTEVGEKVRWPEQALTRKARLKTRRRKFIGQIVRESTSLGKSAYFGVSKSFRFGFDAMPDGDSAWMFRDLLRYYLYSNTFNKHETCWSKTISTTVLVVKNSAINPKMGMIGSRPHLITRCIQRIRAG